MTQKIGMNVEATFDTQRVDQGLNEINRKIDQVNRKPLNPVSPQAMRQLDAINQKFQQLLKVDGELRRRINATGQKGAMFEDIDWSATHPDKVARSKKLTSVREYLGLESSTRPNVPPPPNHPPPPRNGGGGGGGGPTVGGIVTGAAQAGLRAAGPAGGVAAGALGTGMSAGAGAGLMGLMGGLLALGVGKIVGSVMENLHKAEDNSVGYDKLKRTLGDVNVSFNALKAVVTSGADNLKITYGEMGEYAQQFTKAGNMKAGQYTTIGDEVGVGVGMSRSFGLDPSQGVGLMGQMRGMGITSDVQESRRFALLIGETIGKSGAFAKADEVMQAMGSYAEAQTRNSMGGANVSGYGGMFSSMVASGVPGMDASGSASLLNRINASLSAGGAKGEASQFFTAMVGNRMGLDPLQTQVMREGGAFATNDKMFGKDSAYKDYMGKSGPKGKNTFLSERIALLKQQYGGNSDEQKLQLAQATANDLGINMNQAMRILKIAPNQMGDMEKYVGNDITKLNASGIASLVKVVTGTDADRRGVADSLLSRDDLDSKDKRKIEEVMAKQGATEEQKQVLATLVASRDQERTQGSDIRDSKNALDNIKTAMADKLIPLTLEMRHGIMAIAGGGKKSSQEVMKEVIDIDSKERASLIESRKEEQKQQLRNKIYDNRFALTHELSEPSILANYGKDPQRYAEKMKERNDMIANSASLAEQIQKLEEQKVELLKKENERKAKELENIQAGTDARWSVEKAESDMRDKKNASATMQGKTASNFPEIQNDDQRKNVKTMLDIIAASEGANYNTIVGGSKTDDLSQHPNKVGLVTGDGPSTAAGRYQITNTTWKGVQKKLGLTDFSPESQDKAAVELLKQRGAWDDVLKGDYHSAIGKLGNEWVSLPSSTNKNQGKRSWAFVDDAAKKSKEAGTAVPAAAGATPMPAGAGPGRGSDPSKLNVSAEPIVVRHEDTKGNEIKFPQFVNLKFVAPGEPLVQK